ncbi:MAG TPA: hypothetical protein VE673_19840, partial [Pseudonocardiaceae bacterium]|nr:hypothetical protein [Pseudonocardiaceae bacterium]
ALVNEPPITRRLPAGSGRINHQQGEPPRRRPLPPVAVRSWIEFTTQYELPLDFGLLRAGRSAPVCHRF